MNAKNIILKKVCNLNEIYIESVSEETLLEMESILINFLQIYPKDIDMWLRLIMVEFTPPLEDYDRIENYITMILDYDKNNITALLILAYAQYIFRGTIQRSL